MKRIVVLILLVAIQSRAETLFYTKEPSNGLTKLAAVKAAMNHQRLYRCNEVEMTDKLTFKNVKVLKTATK